MYKFLGVLDKYESWQSSNQVGSDFCRQPATFDNRANMRHRTSYNRIKHKT